MKRIHMFLMVLFSLMFSIGVVAGGYGHHDDDDNGKSRMTHPADIGPYNVGTITIKGFEVTGGNTVNLTVWYPTHDRALKQTKYQTEDNSAAFYSTGAKFAIVSPNNAIENAKPAKGRFPLIINSHGAIPPFADFYRLTNMPKHEHMASHGFIVLGYNRAAQSDAQDAEDIRALIDEMATISGNSVLDEVKKVTNTRRVGATGFSSGAPAVMTIVAGTTTPGEVVTDNRIKGIYLIEPSINNANVTGIKVPYLITDGSPFYDFSGFIANDTPLAVPRYRLTVNNSAHIAKFSAICTMISENRNLSLALTGGALGEPLVDVILDDNAEFAYFWWNTSELLFGVPGFTLGNAREWCNKIGVVAPNGALQGTFFDLDLDDNGETDTPPLNTDLAGNPSILPQRLSESEDFRLGLIYEVAFFKVHVANDKRYKRYLHPQYSDQNEPNASLEVYEY